MPLLLPVVVPGKAVVSMSRAQSWRPLRVHLVDGKYAWKAERECTDNGDADSGLASDSRGL